MALYGKSDAASNVHIGVVMQVNHKGAAVNTANRDALYGNTTADAFTTGVTQGIFGVDVAESRARRAGDGAKTSPGWVLRTVGSGGRANRVQTETLAFVRMSTDAEDTVFRDALITINTQPSNATVTAPAAASFTAAATSVPSVSLTYKWQLWNGSAFADITDAGVYTNSGTATLNISNSTGLTGKIYRVSVAATGATNVFSANATLTVN